MNIRTTKGVEILNKLKLTGIFPSSLRHQAMVSIPFLLYCNTGMPTQIRRHPETRLVHLDVEECSEELLRQQSYAIKNQLGHPKPPLGALALELWMPELVLYGIRLLAKQFLGTFLDIEVDQSEYDTT